MIGVREHGRSPAGRMPFRWRPQRLWDAPETSVRPTRRWPRALALVVIAALAVLAVWLLRAVGG